jgi:NAD+ diphosphatase
LVRAGDSCLLGRQPIWPPGFFSTIAGFVEPGESAEAAVVREVFEETGIRVGEVYYDSSQPWPFPCSLMLGFSAHAQKDQPFLLRDELEDARWFTRVELRDAVESGRVRLPSLISIAFHLVESWYDEDSPEPLRELASVPGRTR